MTKPLRSLVLAAAVVPFALGTACKDQGKESAAKASESLKWLVALTEKDVAEVERGLPAGAKKLEGLVAKGGDPRKDIAGVRTALKKVRREVEDLNLAKSTFFALADEKGVAIRNDLEEDVMAGQNLFMVFPELTKAGSDFTTTTGAFPNASGKAGPDKDWIAGVPVKKEDGTTGAVFVTGWSYRYFARHLAEALKGELLNEAKAQGREGRIPVFYIGVFDKSGVYSSPLTPQLNEKAMVEADLVAKTASGPYQSSATLADRTFGYAAARVPKLAPDTGIVILRSEL